MPSRSRHSRNHNNHSNRSSNKNRNNRPSNGTAQSSTHNHNHSHKHQTQANCNISKKHTHNSDDSKSDKSAGAHTFPYHKLLTHESYSQTRDTQSEKSALSDIKDLESEIILEFKSNQLSIADFFRELSLYSYRRNANALFLFGLIQSHILHSNVYLFEMESNENVRNSFLKVLFTVTNKISFKNVINQNAWALSLIKLLQTGLPSLCNSVIHTMTDYINNNGFNDAQNIDSLRFIIMFLRPEIVEQSAELVQFNASIFEQSFRQLIAALSDNYQPFRVWLFHRLCSKKRESTLIEPQLAKFICFGEVNDTTVTHTTKAKKVRKRAKSLLINVESSDDCDTKEENSLERLMNAFKFCMNASNQLVINNQSRTYYELGHLILNDVIGIASTLRYHFMDNESENEFCKMIAIMHCNLGSIYLHQNKANKALESANKAREFDKDCIQSHRIRAQYYIKYKNDINSGMNDLHQILHYDEDHPYAINTQKEIVQTNKMSNNVYMSHCSNSNGPCPREKHSAVSYRNDRLLVYGGCPVQESESESMSEECLNDLWIFDVNNNRWMQLDTIGITPCERHSHSANIIQHKLYIIGGANTGDIYRRKKEKTFKYHRFSTYKSSKNPKKRVFALNSTDKNGTIIESVVTLGKDKKSDANKGGYALGGWFTNFFKDRNDEKIAEIKELAHKGIVESDDTDSISMSSEESDCPYTHYESTFPAIEMLDLKHNKWIRPETTGTSPKDIMINHRSICVGKRIFVFPTNYSFPYAFEEDANQLRPVRHGYVLYTDTLHWESFEIPKTHKIVQSQQVIPVMYDKRDKIMFVSPFNGSYHIHCLLFTKNMEWSPVKKMPAMNKLSGYNRLTHFAYESFGGNYVVIHGGILKENLYKSAKGKNDIHLLGKLPLISDAISNVIDGSKEYSANECEYDSECESEYYSQNCLNELQPLYTVNNENTHESRVSIVESLLCDRNPLELHRIGPIQCNEWSDESVSEESDSGESTEEYGQISYQTMTRTTMHTRRVSASQYKTTRTRTITTTHRRGNGFSALKKKLLLQRQQRRNINNTHSANDMIDLDLLFNIRCSDIDKYGKKLTFLSNFEIFDFISMRWLPRIGISWRDSIYSNHLIECGESESESEMDLLQSARINHTITMVGNSLCIFGGINSANVVIIDNFMKATERINNRFYKNYALNIASVSEDMSMYNSERDRSENGNSNYCDTTAVSLTKHLFGVSPNKFSNGSYRMVQCAHCLILECNRFNFRTCSGCAQVQYCSKLCQKNNWKLSHRHFCTKNHIRYQ